MITNFANYFAKYLIEFDLNEQNNTTRAGNHVIIAILLYCAAAH